MFETGGGEDTVCRFFRVTCLLSFLPRDAMHVRGLCRRAVCGWLVSVTFVYCIETAEDTVTVAK